MKPPICPMCKSGPQTVMVDHFRWSTACRCTTGRSSISATHSVKRWEVNARKRNELRAVAIIASRSGQP